VQLSLLELSRARHPQLSDEEHVALIAAGVVRELDEYPPIRLPVVASYRDIAEIKVEPMSFAGSLTQEARGFVIRVRAGDSRRRRRFSGFHEVGHTFLPGYADVPQYRCQPELRPGRRLNNESLSDTAASELLIPRKFFVSDLASADFGLETVTELADRYDASVQATAHRFVQLWPEPSFLVLLTPCLKPADANDADAQPKLRVVWAHGRGAWPYVPRHKSAAEGGALDRALAGEIVRERTTLAELSAGAEEQLEVSTRAFHYRDADGELVPQVLAVYRRATRAPVKGR
jgi:IrrE N-terminal-like domain